jgi:hypothetical protein
MLQSRTRLAPRAHLTLRAHRPSPARVELVYRPRVWRLAMTVAWIVVCWGSIPLLLWVPPHYPWITLAFLAGAYFAHRSWNGRYSIRSFAGICPRCGSAMSLGVERTVDLPHTLTCFSCHFEPRLEVNFVDADDAKLSSLEHQWDDCVGLWELRWLADEQFLYCDGCHAGAPARAILRERADAENAAAMLLNQLTDEGRPLI